MSRFRSQITEVINRNTVISLALAQGFNAYLPVYDGGVDFILYRERDGEIRKVQLKGRWMIDKKYIGRDIWMAFPISGQWYLMPHDQMVSMGEAEGITKTLSWTDGGAYSKPKPSATTIEACRAYRFSPIEDIAREASEGVPETD